MDIAQLAEFAALFAPSIGEQDAAEILDVVEQELRHHALQWDGWLEASRMLAGMLGMAVAVILIFAAASDQTLEFLAAQFNVRLLLKSLHSVVLPKASRIPLSSTACTNCSLSRLDYCTEIRLSSCPSILVQMHCLASSRKCAFKHSKLAYSEAEHWQNHQGTAGSACSAQCN